MLYLCVVAHMALANLLIAKESQTIILFEHLHAYKINDRILLMITNSKQFHGWFVRRISVETSTYVILHVEEHLLNSLSFTSVIQWENKFSIERWVSVKTSLSPMYAFLDFFIK